MLFTCLALHSVGCLLVFLLNFSCTSERSGLLFCLIWPFWVSSVLRLVERGRGRIWILLVFLTTTKNVVYKRVIYTEKHSFLVALIEAVNTLSTCIRLWAGTPLLSSGDRHPTPHPPLIHSTPQLGQHDHQTPSTASSA